MATSLPRSPAEQQRRDILFARLLEIARWEDTYEEWSDPEFTAERRRIQEELAL